MIMVKDYGKTYIKVRPPLVRVIGHLRPKCLEIAVLPTLEFFGAKRIMVKLNQTSFSGIIYWGGGTQNALCLSKPFHYYDIRELTQQDAIAKQFKFTLDSFSMKLFLLTVASDLPRRFPGNHQILLYPTSELLEAMANGRVS